MLSAPLRVTFDARRRRGSGRAALYSAGASDSVEVTPSGGTRPRQLIRIASTFMPKAGECQPPSEFTPMKGSSDSIHFVAVIRTGFSAKSLRDASYTTEVSPTGATLIRKSRQHRLPLEGEILQVQSEELYKGISKLKFGYLTRDAENRMNWLDAWATQAKLPVAVRFEISAVADGVELKAFRTVSLLNEGKR